MAVAELTRVMEIETPLGADLEFHRMTLSESLGRLSEAEVDLLSGRNDITFSDILSKNVTVRLELPEGDRFFNGYVTRFAYTGMRGRKHLYRASVRPWLWFLTRTSNCRMFQDMTVKEIIEKVFAGHGVSDVEWTVSSTRKREYCVQYRETDFNFVSRLMEQEGLYYYFKHQNGRNTMVITDSYSGHATYPGYAQIPFIPSERKRPDHEAITEWMVANEVQPGRYALDDYHFEGPALERLSQHVNVRKYELADYEMYDYPGDYVAPGEGEQCARTRLEELQTQFHVARGVTNCRGLATGSLFTLKGHTRAAENREYLVIDSTHELQYNEYESTGTEGASYHCTFRAIASREPFRSPRISPRPVVQGPQTAIIVGPAGDEIYTDKYGRVKVQFHWDRYGKADQNSSCWIRVSQNWAGKRWGAMFLPRIGQEVIVDFLEGDPDRPIITGRVYNGEAMPPYSLPDEMTKSTIKTYSSKGGGGFNEIRFEDKKGKEQLFLHAEHNQDNRVKNDTLEWIGNDRHLIVKHDQLESVDGDKHLTVKNDQNEKVTGTVSLQAGQDLQHKVGMKHALDAGMEIHLKAGMKVVVEAGVQLTLKVGGNFIDINPGGVFIQGTMVMINSGGSAGSGSGCSPNPPTAPKEADTAEPGQKLEPPKAPKPPQQKGAKVSPQTVALKQAAQSGVPFCEKCEEAARAQQSS
jgi:type VI secretion system secreted protein VgrG